MKKTILTSVAAASFLLCGLCGISMADKTVAKERLKKPAVKAKSAVSTAVFDLAHSEIFSPVKEGPLNYTLFYGALKLSGEEVGINREPITKARLSGVRTYIIAGPITPLNSEEVSALESFVKEGGNLLVLLHISGPVAELTNSFGIAVSNFTLAEEDGLIDGKPQDFFVTDFAAHPVTSGLEKIAVFGTWGLMAEGGATVVASTGAKAWADLDRDRQFDEGEPRQAFGVMAVSSPGKGKVVIIADDAPFANRFINEAGNSRLIENILMWFKE